MRMKRTHAECDAGGLLTERCVDEREGGRRGEERRRFVSRGRVNKPCRNLSVVRPSVNSFRGERWV